MTSFAGAGGAGWWTCYGGGRRTSFTGAGGPVLAADSIVEEAEGHPSQ